MVYFLKYSSFGTVALLLLSQIIKRRVYPMKAINSAVVLEESHIDLEKTFLPSVLNESREGFSDHSDEPGFFFRGAVFGLLFCLPFWAVIFWLII